MLALDYPSDNVPENIADLGDATLQYPEDPALSSELTLAYPAPVDDSQRKLALSPGKILDDRYRVHSRLGEGGMGEVWRAFVRMLRGDVALKALRGELTAELAAGLNGERMAGLHPDGVHR